MISCQIIVRNKSFLIKYRLFFVVIFTKFKKFILVIFKFHKNPLKIKRIKTILKAENTVLFQQTQYILFCRFSL